MAVSGRRPIGAVDTIWLEMDRPNNLMVIDSLMWFDESADWERVAAVVQRRLVDHFPVFRQRPVESSVPMAAPHWEDDPDFSLDRHLRRAVLPAPGDDACLQQYVEAQMHQPLDRNHPLWELHLIDGYLGGSAMVTRFHHAIADGIALAHVLLSLTDAEPTDDLVELESVAEVRADDDTDQVKFDVGTAGTDWSSMVLGAASALTGPATAAFRGAMHLAAGLPHAVNPAYAVDALTLALQTGHIADKLLLGSNPDTPLSGTPGVPKRAVWSQPRPLSDIKRVGRLAGATVNDVLVSAVSGALSTYLMSHDGKATDLTTMVPVNIRPVDQPLPRELGNRFALVMLPLPSATRAPLARLAEVKRRMDSIKRSPEAVITFSLINAIGLTHPRVEEPLVSFFSGKAIGVTTNVMGPTSDRWVAGAHLEGVLGWVPGSGKQTLGVCIFSYNNTVRVGFKTDAGIVPDPERLVATFDEELDELARMAKAF